MGRAADDQGDAPESRATADSLDADEARLAEVAAHLADAIDAALPRWVVAQVRERIIGYQGRPPDDATLAAAEQAGRDAVAEVGPEVRALLLSDIDDQRTTPLTLLRDATRYPTSVLRAAAIPPVARDETEERLFPGDVYALVPASFADLDPALHEPGIAWGAAKAFVHLKRRRAGR
jgi:hypothetical protein